MSDSSSSKSLERKPQRRRREPNLPRRRSSRNGPPEVIHGAIERLGIKNWDVLLIGDGSGTGWNRGCGWACTVIEHEYMSRRLIHGANNVGTVNIAELSAYVYAMLWFADQYGRERIKRKARPLQVHIITDSQTIATQGRAIGETENDDVANRALWSVMTAFMRQGYVFHYHWLQRMSLELNWAADRMAGQSREAVEQLRLRNNQGQALSIYTLNSFSGSPADSVINHNNQE